jgi:hypothetical protein
MPALVAQDTKSRDYSSPSHAVASHANPDSLIVAAVLTCCSASILLSGDLSGAGMHSPVLGGGLRPGSALPQWNPRPQRQEWKDPRPGVLHHRRDSPTVWLTNGRRQGAKVVPRPWCMRCGRAGGSFPSSRRDRAPPDLNGR